jgi:RNA polymerase sigma factor (sigma-70 family)
MPETRPVAELVAQWRLGEESAAAELHRRYAQRLCALAEQQIGQRLRRRVGAEDIVQSVFRTFFRRTGQGEYPIDHSGSLWQLLVTIMLNKVRRQGAAHRAAKRDVGVEVPVADGELSPVALARDPAPDDAVVLLDELESLLAGLKSPEPDIIRLCLEGYSSPEIADQLACSRWTVRRVLDRFGTRLRRRLEDESGS